MDRGRAVAASPVMEFHPARGRDAAAFLPALLEVEGSPPHPLARVTSGIILALVTAAVVWASVGRVDEVAVAPGKLVPRGEVKPVQPAESGVVRAIRVADGQRVRQGDVVLELDPTEADADRARLGHELAAARREHSRLTALRAALDDADAGQVGAGSNEPPADREACVLPHASAGIDDPLDERQAGVLQQVGPKIDDPRGDQSASPGQRVRAGIDGTPADRNAGALQDDLLRSELAAHRAEVEALVHEAARTRAERSAVVEVVAKLEATLPLVSRRAEAVRRLSEGKLVAEHTHLEVEQTRLEREGELKAQRARLLEVEAGIRLAEERRAAVETGYRRDVLARLAEAERRLTGLEEELRKAEHRLATRTLRAPADGVVQQLAVHSPGAVVGASQPVLVVVPDGADLEVEARLANRDVGFVRAGQEAVIKLEAFPFTRYGTINGTVTRVSEDAVADERQGLSYALRVALARQDLDSGGAVRALSPGMAAAVEVKTGERRLINFFLAPLIRYRDESLRER